MFQVNQIVKGNVCGEEGVQVKAVNPANHAETKPGEFFLPLNAIKAL